MRINNNIKQVLWVVLLGMLLSGCATVGKHSGSDQAAKQETDSEMGVRYLLGRGVEQSDEKAFHYFKEAASDGDPFADNELAYLYAAGKGTKQNYEKAVFYYQLAAFQNIASAQFNLGLLYMKGLGVSASQVEGMKWIEKSAAHDFEPAKQYLLQHQSETLPDAHTT